ncbi:MAG: translocation/assembly module TamB domain-containing protein [Selenomonadaceae bacterium]|nr:translocation/assembly module TamB domain-containing protein [Selenomonadaceae bacterium]
MKGKILIAAVGVFIGIVLSSAWLYVRSAAFMGEIGGKAAELAAEALDVPVEVGSIEVDSFHSLVVKDIAVYDKQAECIARAGEARVGFRLLSVLHGDPVSAVEEIVLKRVEANIVQRDDSTWNLEDIKTKEGGETSFRGKVRVEEGTVRGCVQDRELVLEQVAASLDMASYPVMKAEIEAENQGASARVSGTLGEERQIAVAELEGVDLENYLSLVPEGLLPENVEILSGEIPKGKVALLRQYGELSFSGQAEYEMGAVRVEETEIEDIHGFATFTDSELMLIADAEAAGQQAHVHGKLRWDTGEPYMDLYANSDAFDPGMVLSALPIHGAVDFRAHVTGSFKNPSVDGDFHAAAVEAEGISVENASTHVYFADYALYLQKVSAGVFGGTVRGEGELRLDDMDYTGHLQVEGMDAARLEDYVPELSGKLSADLGIHGQGRELDGLTVYGSIRAQEALYQGLPISDLSASFYSKGKDITIDYLSLQMPNHSDIGVEGTVKGGNALDLSFYGGHVDLSLFSKVVPQADIDGWGDFRGSIKGSIHNPEVSVDLSCLRGNLFKQPFDTLKASAEGSLDGVGIREFFMEKDGHEVWQVKGQVGFVGERGINLRVDTIGARMEDIAALVAPDQPITGNVDNVVQITGTLDKPKVTGYIHMYRGSYRGMLVIGMDGDYFLEGDRLRLQEAHIWTPMIDMDVSGTLDYKTKQMNMELSVHDIDMKRLEHHFPYEVSGHGTFSGRAMGTLDQPVFEGILNATEIKLNDQSIADVHGQVGYERDLLRLKDFGFVQNDGRYALDVAVGVEAHGLSGNASVRNADINALLAILGQKDDKIKGCLDADVTLGGTVDNPSVRISGSIPEGTLAGYDIHGVELKARLADRVLTVSKFSGAQGSSGHFEAFATINREGPIQGGISAYDLEAGIFSGLGGIETKIEGMADVEAQFGGVIENPAAEISVQARNGGVKGATFDDMHGVFHLKNGLIQVEDFLMKKTVGDQNYQASVKGMIPLRALFAKEGEEFNDYEQIKLDLVLDQADLSLLPVLSEYVEWAMGETQGGVEITGTLAHPQVRGSISVPDGSMKFAGVKTPVTDMRLLLDFKGTSVEMEEFSGRMGNGTYQMTGAAVFEGQSLSRYNLDLNMEGLDFDSSFYRGPLSGQFHISEGRMEPLPGREVVLPQISGDLHVENCMISTPAIPEEEGAMPEMLLDLSLDLGKKVHFYSPHLYDMYLDGSVHFAGTTREPKSSGMISVRRGGNFTYMNTVFNIRNGEIQFNQVGSFLPSISFFADARLGSTKIFLAGRGPLGSDKMKIRLTSHPEMSQTEIMHLLTFGSKNNKKDVGNLLLTGLQMSVLSDLENSVREILYLDLFQLSRGSGSTFTNKRSDDDYYSLTVGKYIGDKLLLRYTQGLGKGSNKHRVSMTYDITDNIGLTVEREDRETVFGMEARFKF